MALMNNLFSTSWLKVELVDLVRNLYSLTNSIRYMSLYGTFQSLL